MKRSEEAYRVAVVPVRLSTTDYRQAHAACHRAAGLWNHTTTALGEYWETHSADPTVKELRHLAAASELELQHLHAHTKQAIVDDVLDAVHTSRTNKARHPHTFATARAPWRVKQYRPLSFTRNYGWHVLNGNRINLSFGRGQPGLKLPLPTVIDSRTGVAVPADRWGEIRLCWDRNARQWSLHIAYQTLSPAAGDPTRFVGIDPGIINPMTVAVETPTEYTVTVINGRHARALKTPAEHRSVGPTHEDGEVRHRLPATSPLYPRPQTGERPRPQRTTQHRPPSIAQSREDRRGRRRRHHRCRRCARHRKSDSSSRETTVRERPTPPTVPVVERPSGKVPVRKNRVADHPHQRNLFLQNLPRVPHTQRPHRASLPVPQLRVHLPP